MDITPRVNVGLITIDSYGNGGFRCVGKRIEGAVLAFPDRLEPMVLSDSQTIALDSLQPLLEIASNLDIVLIGHGAQMQFLSKDIRHAFEAVGVSIDSMDTGAACRTFNILQIEERRVAAAMIAVD